MNKYTIFFEDLKKYLTHNNLQDRGDFKPVTDAEINQLGLQIPLAYREWLKIFGNVDLLLNFHLESYTLEYLSYSMEEESRFRKISGEERELLLITSIETLEFFLVVEEENPTTYMFNITTLGIIEKEIKFTNHIKNLLIAYINNHSNKPREWFLTDRYDRTTRPVEFKEEYQDLLNLVDVLEEVEDRIIPIAEIVQMWNEEFPE